MDKIKILKSVEVEAPTVEQVENYLKKNMYKKLKEDSWASNKGFRIFFTKDEFVKFIENTLADLSKVEDRDEYSIYKDILKF